MRVILQHVLASQLLKRNGVWFFTEFFSISFSNAVSSGLAAFADEKLHNHFLAALAGLISSSLAYVAALGLFIWFFASLKKHRQVKKRAWIEILDLSLQLGSVYGCLYFFPKSVAALVICGILTDVVFGVQVVRLNLQCSHS